MHMILFHHVTCLFQLTEGAQICFSSVVECMNFLGVYLPVVMQELVLKSPTPP